MYSLFHVNNNFPSQIDRSDKIRYVLFSQTKLNFSVLYIILRCKRIRGLNIYWTISTKLTEFDKLNETYRWKQITINKFVEPPRFLMYLATRRRMLEIRWSISIQCCLSLHHSTLTARWRWIRGMDGRTWCQKM